MSTEGLVCVPWRQMGLSSAQDRLTCPQEATRGPPEPICTWRSPTPVLCYGRSLGPATVAAPSHLMRDSHPLGQCVHPLTRVSCESSGGVPNGWLGDPGWRRPFSLAPSTLEPPGTSCSFQRLVALLLQWESRLGAHRPVTPGTPGPDGRGGVTRPAVPALVLLQTQRLLSAWLLGAPTLA